MNTLLSIYLGTVLVLALLSAVLRNLPRPRWARGAWTALRRFARRRWLTVGTVFLLALCYCGVEASINGLPVPAILDEFNYLLAGDTFRQGRLTNPPHPHWVFFESLHTLQIPTYMAKYPPGQGLMLALGWWLFGEPIVGVWIGFAFACAAGTWMLQQFFRPHWAFYGGLLSVFLWASWYWTTSYWGGGLAASGSCLALGGLKRSWDSPSFAAGTLLGLGLGILALTRPFEGLVSSLPLLIALLVRWLQPAFRRKFAVGLLGAALTLGLIGGWLGYYHYRVTGSPWKMPYVEHDRQYAANPTFLFQPLPDAVPSYRHQVLQDYWLGWERKNFEKASRSAGFNAQWLVKLYVFSLFAVGPWLLVPWLAFLVGNRRPWLWLAFASVACFGLAISQILYFLPHYSAPVFGPMLLIPVQGLRLLGNWRVQHARPLWTFAQLFPWVVGGFFLFNLGNPRVPMPWASARVKLQHDLKAQGGEHLVFVQYGPRHAVAAEWVYNGADRDQEKVLFARDMGADKNRELIQFYSRRKAWLLQIEVANRVPGVPPGTLLTFRLNPIPPASGGR